MTPVNRNLGFITQLTVLQWLDWSCVTYYVQMIFAELRPVKYRYMIYNVRKVYAQVFRDLLIVTARDDLE